jgi:glycosyltransferase involved in cell wall biosynthesis
MNDRMKICFVCGEYPPAPHGGIGTMVQTLARALVVAGHEVRVAGLYTSLSQTTRENDRGVDVWRLRSPVGRLRWIQARRQLFSRVAEWSRQGKIDLIEVPDWQGWAAYWPPLSVPVVTRLNGSTTYFDAEMGRPTRWLTRHLESRSLRRSNAWCSVSHYTAGKTRAIFRLQSEPRAILPNPVEVAPSTEWQRRRKGTVVFSGTLTEKKGVVQLVDAWNRLALTYPQATLRLLGKDGAAPGGGSMTTYLRSRLSAMAGQRVHFDGHVPRETVLTRLAEARVAVFPSFAEAFAIAPLEAMAAGCPTVASSLGSGPELIEHGHDGLTVDPRRPAEIEDAISRLLSDEPFAQTMAARGRQKIESRFSLARMLTANVEFYSRCVAEHAKRTITTVANASHHPVSVSRDV